MFRIAGLLLSFVASAQVPSPLWNDQAMKDLEIPLAHSKFSPKHIPAEAYYRIPVRPVWKTYPVYHPDRMSAGYMEWLAVSPSRPPAPRLVAAKGSAFLLKLQFMEQP